MAGAGYKLFNTGDVLTAAQVNTYLMEQTVMVFADAAARTTALTGIVSEGMISYLKDTNAVEVYNGSAWVASDDPNAIQNTIVDAKGDLITATAADTPARLAVGSNGDTLVADSAATTGLRWQGNYSAGKNKLINADFAVNQRNFTTGNTDGVYGFDRWRMNLSNATGTYTAETFTPGSAPVAGYEAKNYAKLTITTGNDFCGILQRLEDVRTFAGQTITVSFWAKGTNPTTEGGLYVWLVQSFGTGGSPSSNVVTQSSKVVLTGSWARYSVTINVPSISGKTFGTNNDSYFQVSVGQGNIVSSDAWTLEIWGVQAEAGNVATAFQTATGTLQGELAAAMRYFYRISNQSTGHRIGNGFNSSTTRSIVPLYFPVAFRGSPSVTASNVTDFTLQHGATPTNTNASAIGFGNVTGSMLDITVDVASGLTIGALSQLRAANGTGYIDFSAEL